MVCEELLLKLRHTSSLNPSTRILKSLEYRSMNFLIDLPVFSEVNHCFYEGLLLLQRWCSPGLAEIPLLSTSASSCCCLVFKPSISSTLQRFVSVSLKVWSFDL